MQANKGGALPADIYALLRRGGRVVFICICLHLPRRLVSCPAVQTQVLTAALCYSTLQSKVPDCLVSVSQQDDVVAAPGHPTPCET